MNRHRVTHRYAAAVRVCAGLAVALTARPALAQERVSGPFAGLFGGKASAEHSQSLDVRANFGVGYDTNVQLRADEPVASANQPQRKRLSEGISAGLSYDRLGDRVHNVLNAGTSLRQYVGPQDFFAATYNFNDTLNARLGSKISLDATGSAILEPFFQVSPIFGREPDAGIGFAVDDTQYSLTPQRNATMRGSVSVVDQFSKRSSVSATVNGMDVHFAARPDARMQSWGARGSFVHRLNRSLSMRLGYGRDETRYDARSTTAPIINDIIDAGVDYGSGFTPTRRTSFSFATSTSLLHQNGDTNFRLNGDASVVHAFGRTWTATAGYGRSTEFVAGFLGPLFTDSVNGTLNGLFGIRTILISRVSASRAQVGFASTDTFTTYTGSSKVSVGLSQKLGAYLEYSYYHYNLPAGSTVFELRPRLSRQAVSAGISLWLPLATEMRLPRDPR
jgi:hypothetical protein